MDHCSVECRLALSGSLFAEGMRLKHELRPVDVPHVLSLSNKAVQGLNEITDDRSDSSSISPETLSHRLQQGWQHLQDYPETLLNNNHNSSNNNPDDASTSVAPFFDDGDFQAMSSDESGSSSEDESSSISYSDTSPLLDVSSLDSDVSLDSDMSEDGCLLENNNNLLESAWRSFSPVPSRSQSSVMIDKATPRGQVILPDVLPVVVGKVPRDEDDPMSDSSALGELEIKVEKREAGVEASGMPGDCCVVEITTQPDIQVDIRVNSSSPRPFMEKSSITGNTHSREISNEYKRSTKTKDVNTWTVEDKYNVGDMFYKSPSRYWSLGEGVRLNNFTIVNGLKTLSLTELVKPNGMVHHDHHHSLPDTKSGTINSIPIDKPRHHTDVQKMREKNHQHPPGNIHVFCKGNKVHHREKVVLKTKPSTDTSKRCTLLPALSDKNTCSPKPCSAMPSSVHQQHQQQKLKQPESPKRRVSSRRAHKDDNSNQCSSPHHTSTSTSGCASRKEVISPRASKTNDSKLSSPELFEVYTMETAVPHIDWAAIAKASKESEWIRKRRNDREEIRRKLAMDSDTEDYISERLGQNTVNGSSIDRIKGGTNLQICFMNEAVNDQDSHKSDQNIQVNAEKPQDRLLKSPKLSSESSSAQVFRCDKGPSRIQNNNNCQAPVTKRQRPTFFFNRPRSWNVPKSEKKTDPEEDLITRHLRLQAEARQALAQAKDMARMQMEIERQKKKKSPITEIVGIPFPDSRNLLSRHVLVDMNVAQLQVIVNDLHSQIESLNEDLVKFLLERDDLHMEQDSMLVDIEDLTRYLGLKGSNSVTHPSNSQPSVKICTGIPNRTVKTEPVRRSQSVHVRKAKNLM